MRPVDAAYGVRRILCAVDHLEPSLRAADFSMNLRGNAERSCCSSGSYGCRMPPKKISLSICGMNTMPTRWAS